MSYTLNKTGAQIDVILNRAEAGGQLDLDIAAEAAARAAADALKAPLASPALTGTPTAPTAAPGTDTTQLATTAFASAAAAAAAASAASGKADKVAGATAGNLAGLDASGNLTDAGVAAEDVATKADVQNITPKRTAANAPASSSFSVLCDTAIAGEAKPKIYGKSVVINQLQYNGNFASADGWNGGTVADGWIETTAGAASYAFAYNSNPVPEIVASHKYYACGTIKAVSGLASGSTTIVLQIGGTDSTTEAIYANNVILANGSSRLLEGIFSPKPLSVGTNKRANWGVYNNVNAIDAKWTNLNIIDLTVIFTAAELTAIGTSVANLKAAWLKKFGYPLPQYIDYNPGSIVSNNATYQMHGRNLFNAGATWTSAGNFILNDNGVQVADNFSSYYTEVIKVAPNTEYYIKGVASGIQRIYYYDANNTFISRSSAFSQDGTITTPSNCAYIGFQYVRATLNTANWCINLSDASFNGQYEASFNGGSVTADNLNGIGTVVDSQDAEGQIVRKCRQSTVSVSQIYVRSTNPNCDFAVFTVPALWSTSPFAVMGDTGLSQSTSSSFDDETVVGAIKAYSSVNLQLAIAVAKGTTLAQAQAVYDGATIVYAVATPTTSTTSAADLSTQAGYNSLDPVAGDVQSGEAEVEYGVDVIAYIDKKLAEL